MDRDDAIELAAARAMPLFQKFGWEYFDGRPDEARLRSTLQRLFGQLDEADEDVCMVGSGRFHIHRSHDSEDISLTLASTYLEA